MLLSLLEHLPISVNVLHAFRNCIDDIAQSKIVSSSKQVRSFHLGWDHIFLNGF